MFLYVESQSSTVKALKMCTENQFYSQGKCHECNQFFGTLVLQQTTCISCNDMVLFDADDYEVQVASRLCVDPYQPISNQNLTPYSEPAKSQSIVLPIIIVILAVIFCLACVVGIPVCVYLYKKRSQNKDFTDINQIPNPDDDLPEYQSYGPSSQSRSRSRKAAEEETRGPNSNIIEIEGLPDAENSFPRIQQNLAGFNTHIQPSNFLQFDEEIPR